MVVTQLVEWLLPISEVLSSNPVIGKLYITYMVLSTVLKSQNNVKETENGRFKRIYSYVENNRNDARNCSFKKIKPVDHYLKCKISKSNECIIITSNYEKWQIRSFI